VRTGFAEGLRVPVFAGGDEHQAAGTHLNFVAGPEVGGGRDASAVNEGAVLGRGVVGLAALAGVNEDGATAPRHVGLLDHDVVVRQPADRISAHLERV